MCFKTHWHYQAKLIAQQTTEKLFSYRLVMLFCIGASMSNPALLKLTKPTGGLRHTWFQIITRFLLCFAEDDRPCLDGLWANLANFGFCQSQIGSHFETAYSIFVLFFCCCFFFIMGPSGPPYINGSKLWTNARSEQQLLS